MDTPYTNFIYPVISGAEIYKLDDGSVIQRTTGGLSRGYVYRKVNGEWSGEDGFGPLLTLGAMFRVLVGVAAPKPEPKVGDEVEGVDDYARLPAGSVLVDPDNDTLLCIKADSGNWIRFTGHDETFAWPPDDIRSKRRIVHLPKKKGSN